MLHFKFDMPVLIYVENKYILCTKFAHSKVIYYYSYFSRLLIFLPIMFLLCCLSKAKITKFKVKIRKLFLE